MDARSRSRQLVFIPWPVMGHVQIVDFAHHLLRHHNLLLPDTPLSATILLMKLPDHIDSVTGSFTDSLSTGSGSSPVLNFIHLPTTSPSPEWSSRTRGFFTHNLVLSQRSNVADFLQSHRSTIAAVVTDMLCTSMIDVASQFDIPSYIFFTSPASFLGAMLRCQTLHDETDLDVPELKNSAKDVEIPSFEHPVPPNLLSMVLVDRWQWIEREVGLAVEIVLDYHERGMERGLVSDRIEKGIRELMESGSEVRKRAKEIKEKSRMSVVEGGSSFLSFQKLVRDINRVILFVLVFD